MENKTPELQSVLIVGAGIAGCKAALDLAKSNLRIYLVETRHSVEEAIKSSELGFQVKDCSMCLLVPKLLGVKDHPNIELITNADVISLEGKPGHFQAVIRKGEQKGEGKECESCEICMEEIIDQASFKLDNTMSNELKQIYPQFPETMALKILLEPRYIPPCEHECPAHVEAQEYNSLIAKKYFKESLEVIKERCPLPSSIGRICNHPCEAACNRGEIDEPVNICGLKRFVADHVREHFKEEPRFIEEKKNKKVAVVGSGPSGLTVAYQLARRGYDVTIFEKESVAGGMLRVGVPNYRLPPEIIEQDINHIKSYGVNIKTNTPVGDSGLSLEQLRKEFHAIYLGVGLQKSRKLNIEGEDLENIEYAIDFLKKCSLGEKVEVKKKVIVIGGGDVAIDVARSALRKGAEQVQLIMLESEDIIPAQPWEVQEAKEEGIIFNTSRGPKRFVGENGKVKGVETLICSSVFDEQGQFNPVLEACTEEIFEGDMVIVSIGQAADLEFLNNKIEISRGIVVDDNFQTSIEGVFAGGEVVAGPGSAIKAIASGNKVAAMIDKYLKGESLPQGSEYGVKYEESRVIKIDQMDNVEFIQKKPRNNAKLLPVKERINNFKEITKTFDLKTAIEEAKRCLQCGICEECRDNVKACVARILEHEGTNNIITLKVDTVILSAGDAWLSCYDLRRKTEYRWKILTPKASIEENKCIGCGDCIDACVFDAITRNEKIMEFSALRDSYNPSISLVRYKSKVISDVCEGCAACVGVCPVGAINLKYFSNEEIAAIIKSLHE